MIKKLTLRTIGHFFSRSVPLFCAAFFLYVTLGPSSVQAQHTFTAVLSSGDEIILNWSNPRYSSSSYDYFTSSEIVSISVNGNAVDLSRVPNRYLDLDWYGLPYNLSTNPPPNGQDITSALDYSMMGLYIDDNADTYLQFGSNGTWYSFVTDCSSALCASTITSSDSVTVTALYYGLLDTTAPTLTSSTPSDDATGVAVTDNIVLTFSENVQAGSGNIVISDGASDTRTIAIGDAQVSISGATVTINPTADLNSSTSYYVQVASTAIEDASGNAYAGISNTTTLNFTTANISTPATEFANYEATIRGQIQTVALQSIRNSVQEANDFMALARERFRVCRVNGSGAKSSICGINVPFDIDGSTSISTSSANIGGSFFGQLGNFDGTYRRMTSGDFNIQRDAEGNTTGALSGRIAWEYLSDNSMLGWFVGAEYAQSDFAGTFTGEQNSFGASIGGYFVSEVQDQLFLDGHLTFRQSEHELQLSNGTLDLESVYHSSTILTGLTLTGVSAINDDAEVSPTLSFNAARTDLGTIGFTGVAYGLTDSTLSMDGGAVSYADISFAPKYRVAMDGQSLPSSLLVATVAPRAMCEYVELTGSTTRSCGSGLSLGLLGTAANGNGSLEFEMALDKVGGQLRHSIGLNASLQY